MALPFNNGDEDYSVDGLSYPTPVNITIPNNPY
ncbi:hypothetical protein [Magpiepox virus 2]|nr:hypothetical protein [Magpiepox virus 2]